MMKKFLFKVIFFATPILVLLTVYEVAMFYYGETKTIQNVLNHQKDNKSLFLRKYLSQEFNTYKTKGIEINSPKILVTGSSRVMQFQESYFTNSFYNSGGLLQNREDFRTFIENIDDAELFIIGIDSWWYKKDNLENIKSWLENDSEEIVLSSSR